MRRASETALERSLVDMSRAYARLAETFFAGCLLLFDPPRGEARVRREDDARRLRMRRTLWRLRRAYEEIVGPGAALSLSDDLQTLRKAMGDVGPALLSWVDAVEVLVQDTERRFGHGQGARKAEVVKATLIHYLLDSRVELPRVPIYLQPLVLEVIIDWTVDGVVLLLNRNDLWAIEEPVDEPTARWLKQVVDRLLWPFTRLARWLSGLTRRWVLSRQPLSPPVRAMLAKLERNRALDPAGLVRQGLTLVEWVGRNRRRIIGLVEVVSIGTKEAERFSNMSGRAKKEYVRDLVVLFLEDLDVLRPGSPVSVPVEWFVDVIIEAVVFLFRKRNVFRPAGSEALSTAHV